MHVIIVVLLVLALTLFEVTFQVLEELLPSSAVESRTGMTVPIAYHQESEEHTAKVGCVCYTVARRAKGWEELNGDIEQYEPLGFDGEGERDDKEPLVGEAHTESQYHSIDGARCTDGGPGIQLMTQLLSDGKDFTKTDTWVLGCDGHIKRAKLGNLL